MKEILKCAVKTNTAFHVLAFCSVSLLVAGFLCPPLAEIHNSVLYAVGEIMGIMALYTLLKAMEKGYDTTFKHKDTSVTISNNDDININNKDASQRTKK